MNIFLKASRRKLRIQTSKGLLTVEQLWGTSTGTLAKAYVTLRKQLAESTTDLNDLKSSTSPRRTNAELDLELSVAILKEIHDTLVTEQEATSQASENRRKAEERNRMIAEANNESAVSIIKGFSMTERTKFTAMSIPEQDSILSMSEEDRKTALK